MGLGNENIALINQLGGKAGGCISTNEAILCAEIERMQLAWNEQKDDIYRQWSESKALADTRLENIKAMSGYLDDVAEALGVVKPSTPVEGIGACWKVIEAIQSIQSESKAKQVIIDGYNLDALMDIFKSKLEESIVETLSTGRRMGLQDAEKIAEDSAQKYESDECCYFTSSDIAKLIRIAAESV